MIEKEGILIIMRKLLKDKKIYLFFIITIAFFGIFVHQQFTTDTYAVLEESGRKILANFLQSGRIVTALLFIGIKLLKIPFSLSYLLSYIMAIFAITFSIYKLYYLLKNEFVKNELIAILVSVLAIINPFSIELFLYIEKGVMTLAILFSVLAVDEFVKSLKNKTKKKNFILSIVYMCLSIFCYQGVVAIYIILATLFVIKYSKNTKEFIINTLKSLVIYGIPALINVFVVKFIFVGSRVNGNINFAESMAKIKHGIFSMFETYNILPKYFFISMFLILFTIAIMECIRNSKHKIISIIGLVYLDVVIVASTIAPFIMQNSASIWFVSRSTYGFASILAIQIVYIFMYIDKDKVIEYLIIMLSIIILALTFYRFIKIEIDHYILNYEDKTICQNIGKKINEYEENTGIKVNKISLYKDKNVRYSYKNLFVSGDINITCFVTAWSDANAICYFNNIKLEKVDNNNNLKEYFNKKDWDDFNDEQIIFENDTVNICVF